MTIDPCGKRNTPNAVYIETKIYLNHLAKIVEIYSVEEKERDMRRDRMKERSVQTCSRDF